MHGFLEEIGISIIAAIIVGVVTLRIKQPIILGYLIAGALIGPEIGLKLVSKPANIEVISGIGMILLLFVIGLEINPKHVIALGKQLLFAGVGQFIFCVLLGLAIFLMAGYGLSDQSIDALYLSLVLALSSTAIVVKLLYDKFELDTISGRITLGILVFQDIWAILILAFQPNFKNPQFILVGLAILKSLALLGIGFLLSKYVLKFVYGWIAKTPEMVVAVSIGWCAIIAGIAEFIGLSKEMGGLIGGISISSFPYSIHVTAKVLPLRDFFLTLFFISLGMKIPLPQLNMILTVLGIALFVIVSRFLTVYPLLKWSGSGRRTSFITSLNLSQISEFSLVIASLGVVYGHIQKDMLSIILYSMALTSIFSSYFIKYNHQIYLLYNQTMNRLGFKIRKTEEEHGQEKHAYPIVILGFHRGARELVELISQQDTSLLNKILVIDYNLEVLKELRKMNIKAVFGDISSIDTLLHTHIEEAKIILSTIPDMLLKGTNNFKLVKTCRALAPLATIVATADYKEQVQELKKAGATEVMLPYSLVGQYFANYLLKAEINNH